MRAIALVRASLERLVEIQFVDRSVALGRPHAFSGRFTRAALGAPPSNTELKEASLRMPLTWERARIELAP